MFFQSNYSKPGGLAGALEIPSAKGCAKLTETERHRGGFLYAPNTIPSLDIRLTSECCGPCVPSRYDSPRTLKLSALWHN